MLRNATITVFVMLASGMGLYLAPAQFLSAVPREAGASDDCRLAISIAEAFLPEATVEAQDVKLIEVRNLLTSGRDCCHPNVWRLTFVDRRLIDGKGLRGKGGQVIVEVNVQTQEAKVIGWGE